MLKVELLGAAITLSILWLTTLAYAVTQGGAPPTGIVVTVITVATLGAWFAFWAHNVRGQLRDVRAEVRHLQEEKDVNDAMERLKPRLRVVHRDQ